MIKLNKQVEALENIIKKLELKIEELEEKKQAIIDNADDHGREITDAEIDVMVDKCSRGGTLTLGGIEILKAEDMRAIYNMAR
jgi:phage shock protein A